MFVRRALSEQLALGRRKGGVAWPRSSSASSCRGSDVEVMVSAHDHPPVGAPGPARPHLGQGGLPPGRLRQLHGPRRRRAHAVLPAAGRGRRRPPGHHARGPHPRRRACTRSSARSSMPTASSAATAPRAWSMVAKALLDHNPAPSARRDRGGAVGQRLPVHGLRPDHRRDRCGRGRRAGGGPMTAPS